MNNTSFNSRFNDVYNDSDRKVSNAPVVISIVLGALLVICSYFWLWYLFFRVVPSFEKKTVELGRHIEADPDEYLTGLSFMHRGAVVDIHDVNPYVEGSYVVKVYHSGDVFEYTININDTFGPDICQKMYGPSDYNDGGGIDENGLSTFEQGVNYYISDLLDYAYEPSGCMEISLLVNGVFVSKVSIDEGIGYKGEDIEEQAERLLKAEHESWNGYSFGDKGVYHLKVYAIDKAGIDNYVEWDIEVVDTTAPCIETFYDPAAHYLATDRIYKPDDLVDGIYENSDFYSAAIIDGDDTLSEISFDTVGEHTVTVYAVDEEGNESTAEATVMVDEAPIFIGVRNKDVLIDTEYDLYNDIVAVDNTDGDVSYTITIDDGGFDSTVKGTYKVKYTAMDSHGIMSTVTCELTVGDNEPADYYLTDEEVSLLCGYDFFEYEPLKDYDYEKAVSLVEPTLVNMIYRSPSGGYSAGSGFIYKIDEDYTYIVTCVHVMADLKDPVEIKFCDDDATAFTVALPEYEALSDRNEIAMFRIETDLIPAQALVDLKEIYCDENVYRDLKIGQEVVAYSGHWLNGDPVIRKMTILNLKTRFVDDAVNCMKTTHNVKAGMSGTAVFDQKGRLVGVVEGYISLWDYDISDYKYSAYQLRIEGLNSLYTRLENKQ